MNSWSITFFESTFVANATAFFIPGTLNGTSGEEIRFIGCSILNQTGIGIKIATNGYVDCHCAACSFDFNGSWAVQNGTSSVSNVSIVEMAGCYLQQPTDRSWVQNFGWCTITGGLFQGIGAGTITYLIDNENAMTVTGGFFFNNGTGGAIFNPSGKPVDVIGSFINGVTPAPIALAASIAIAGKLNSSNADVQGNITSISGTTVTRTFGTPYSNIPTVVVTPKTNAGTYFISAISATGFTITYSTSGAQAFSYIVMGNPD